MRLVSLPWDERVEKIRELIEYANSHYEARLKDIAEATGLSEHMVARVLNGRDHKEAVKATGLRIRGDRGNKKYTMSKSLLSSTDMIECVKQINASATLEEAYGYNPYSEDYDGVLYEWNREVIKTLWRLKQRKIKLYKTARSKESVDKRRG